MWSCYRCPPLAATLAASVPVSLAWDPAAHAIAEQLSVVNSMRQHHQTLGGDDDYNPVNTDARAYEKTAQEKTAKCNK
eukprot:4612705-Pyramimonas_sp.AAC.1